MTSMATEAIVTTEGLEEHDFEIACEIYARRQQDPVGWPLCLGEPARWIAWKHCPCGRGPRYLLICDRCKATYSNWIARGALFTCAYCHDRIQPGPTWLEPLDRRKV